MISRVVNYYNRKKQIVSQFVSNKGYLVPGKYKFDETMNYIHLDDGEIKRKSYDLFRNEFFIITYKRNFKKSIIELMIKPLFNKHLNVKYSKNNDLNFRGSIYLPARRGKNFKIFDLENKKVLHKFVDKEEYDTKISNYEYFKDIYPMPRIYGQDRDNLIVIEEFIDYKTREEWGDEDYKYLLEDIFERNIKYYNNSAKAVNFKSYTIEDVYNRLSKDDEIISYIWNNITKEIRDIKFPFLKLHGDLGMTNTLIDRNSKDINYIDFEHSSDLVCFFDIFCLMWNEFRWREDDSYIVNYFEGKYDYYFERLFSELNLQFNKYNKLDYINIFFLDIYKERWTEMDKISKDNLFNYYLKFTNFDKIKVCAIS